nr:hypothetical protein [Tanacetum cinerariifolium]
CAWQLPRAGLLSQLGQVGEERWQPLAGSVLHAPTASSAASKGLLQRGHYLGQAGFGVAAEVDVQRAALVLLQCFEVALRLGILEGAE